MTVTNEDGDEVDEIVDAGVYTLTVKCDAYGIADAAFTITVSKRSLTEASITNAYDVAYDYYSTDFSYYFVYTGEEIVPEFVFTDFYGDEWVLPADEYTANYYDISTGEKVDLIDEGEYEVLIDINSTNFESSFSLHLDQGRATVTVIAEDASEDTYDDVPTTGDEWYVAWVYQAKTLGYMTGYADGSNNFGPHDSLSRADAVCVLYKMAGAALDGGSCDLPYTDGDEVSGWAETYVA